MPVVCALRAVGHGCVSAAHHVECVCVEALDSAHAGEDKLYKDYSRILAEKNAEIARLKAKLEIN